MFKFDKEKTIETIIYLSKQINNPTKYTVSKLIYLADRLHLQRYGRLITGDIYFAMRFGPVPSNSYELIKKDSFIPDPDLQGAFSVSGHAVVALREPDLDEFSDSDLVILDEIISQYGNYEFGGLKVVCHDETWKSVAGENGEKCEDGSRNGTSIFMDLSVLVNGLPNAEQVKEYLSEHHVAYDI